ncbi:hypothetical protein BC828DRAFT_380205 [Blastocladiella britannica]|nr:hypothetical protein BC828DRAFT_380205 [Blastocladiella britannica]
MAAPRKNEKTMAVLTALATASLLLVLSSAPIASAEKAPGPLGAAAVISSSTLYLFGGYEINNGGLYFSTRGAASLDLSKQFSTDTVSLSYDYPFLAVGEGLAYPVPLVNTATNNVHLIGGYTGRDRLLRSADLPDAKANTSLVFSLSTKSWPSKANPYVTGSANYPNAGATVGHAVDASNPGALALYGGHDFTRGWYSDLLVAGVGGKDSVMLVNASMAAGTGGPNFRATPTVTSVSKDVVIISGGENSAPASLPDVWQYTVSSKQWKSLGKMAMGRMTHTAAIYGPKGDYLIVIGGSPGSIAGMRATSGDYALIEYLYLPTNTWYRGTIDNADASPVRNLTGHMAHVAGNQIVLVGGVRMDGDGVGLLDTPPPAVAVLQITPGSSGSKMLSFKWTDVFTPIAGAASSSTSQGTGNGTDGTSSGGGSNMGVIIGGAAGGLAVLGVIAGFLYVRNRRGTPSSAGAHAPKSEMAIPMAASVDKYEPAQPMSPAGTMYSTDGVGAGTLPSKTVQQQQHLQNNLPLTGTETLRLAPAATPTHPYGTGSSGMTLPSYHTNGGSTMGSAAGHHSNVGAGDDFSSSRPISEGLYLPTSSPHPPGGQFDNGGGGDMYLPSRSSPAKRG